MTQLLQFAWVEADKRANNQVGTVLLDTLYNFEYKEIAYRYDKLCALYIIDKFILVDNNFSQVFGANIT